MFILLLIGLILLGTAAGLVVRAVALPRMRALARLDEISAYGLIHGHVDLTEDRERRGVLSPIATALGSFAAARTERLDLTQTRRSLLAAGYYRVKAETFLGYRLLAAPVLGIMWLTAFGGTAMGIVQAVALAAGGWFVPKILLDQAAARRGEAIDDSLPDLVDLLVVTIETGMAFGGSLQVASQRIEGPLGDELKLVLQEQRMGLPITNALSNMLERVDTPSMRSFVRSTVQGENLGVSIGTIMRNIAVEMRKRRRARAEERANKAPIKMLFPLVFLIFPSLLVVILGPSAIKMIDALGNL